MCTVTWMREHDSYSLFCNRDERWTRKPALGPQKGELRGVKYIAPLDGDHGGSWIAVNQLGLTLCLLNRYGEMQPDETRTYISRGLLLIGLVDSRNTQQVTTRIHDHDLTQFRPFNLLAVSREAEVMLMEWTGSKYTLNKKAKDLLPLTSTSLTEPSIASTRKAQFRSLTSGRPTRSLLDQFHRSHIPARGPSSVCMHREGAKTMSLSKVLVEKGEIIFEYEAGSPCEPETLQVARMELY